MKNQKVPTIAGTIIIIILTITIGVLVWKYQKQQSIIPDQNISLENPKQQLKENLMSDSTDMSLENKIKQAIFDKNTNWEKGEYNISVVVETLKENYAIGKFTYEHGQGKYYNKGEQIWFAARTNETWTITDISAVGYYGICQNFFKYSFPSDMIPDCWDTEKNVQIGTKNPKRFYLNGITEADKKEIIKSFLSFIKDEPFSKYYNLENSYLLINKNTRDFLEGMIFRGGIENHSVPNLYAAKINGKWNVVFNGQDYPSCSLVEKYEFPSEIINKCYDQDTQKERDLRQ